MKTLAWIPMLLLLGCTPAWSATVSRTDSVMIYANDFGDASDVNYDTWPDRWEKLSGENYQHYVNIGIVEDPTAPNGRSLQMELNGGGAAIATPPIHMLPKFGYRLHLKIKTAELKHIEVQVRVELQNRHGEVLQRIEGPRVTEAEEWLDIDLDTFRPAHRDIDRAVICIDAPRTGRGDLLGKVWIDQIKLLRLPSMIIATGRTSNFYDDFSQIRVTCTLSGIREQNPEIRFQLLDATSTEIPGRSEDKRIPLKLIVEDSRMASDIVGGIGDSPSGYEGSTVWEPRIDDYGFYKIRVKMLSQKSTDGREEDDYSRELDDQEITLVVLPPLPKPARGEFGWTLPLADRPLSFDALEEVLPRLGVQWVKLPVWYPADDPGRGETLVKFAERISNAGIEVVGIIDDPTLPDYAQRKASDRSLVANLLQSDPSVWQPIYDHVMTRLSLRFRWWQLGNDYDTSFYSYPELGEKIGAIRKVLFRFGQEVNVGIGWRWQRDTDRETWIPPESNPAWDFEQMSSAPLLTASEIDRQMGSTPKTTAARWMLIDPQPVPLAGDGETPLEPDSPGYHELRIRELVRQMLICKMHQADGIFIANPFTGPDGVLNVDGTPGELLLPWRTTSMLLADKKYLGSLQLPHESTNHVFIGDDNQVVMVIWNDRDSDETLYLGDKIKQIDVWGKQYSVDRNDQGESMIAVGRMPSFIVGLHPAITRWRMAMSFDLDRLPSVFALEQDNNLRGRNFFSQGVTGSFTIHVPLTHGEQSRFGSQHNDTWEFSPKEGQFSIAAGQSFELPFRIMLKEATYGTQPVRVDFDFEADRRYRFSVWRNMEVGLGDVQISVKTWLDESGHLVIEQKMVNNNETPLDFKCLLDAPPRRKKRAHVVMLDAEGSTKVYQYPDGESLIGNVLKLKAEEINGNRVLIYRFIAEP